jgi:Predicted GTPase
MKICAFVAHFIHSAYTFPICEMILFVCRVIPMSGAWDETSSSEASTLEQSEDHNIVTSAQFPIEETTTNIDDDDDDDSYIDDDDDINHQEHWVKEPHHPLQDHDDSTTLSYMDNNDQLVPSSEEMYSMEEEEECQKETIADLDRPGSFVIVAKGGRGGVGNCTLAKRQHIPELVARAHEKARGEQGEVVHLELELKLIADVGLVGYPNAGKSSLLAAVSKAMPKIAPYPFTTIHPWVGAVEYRDGFRVLLADVPGLIGGASQGRGRGFDFLRHLERTKALVYLLDAAGVDGRDPLTDLRVLVEEVRSYGNGDMLQRPALVVANKMDLIHDPRVQDEILYAISVTGKECGIQFDGEVHGISAGVSGEGLANLSVAIRSLIEK